MERNPHPIRRHPTSGGLIRLQARLTDLTTWLSPAWAASCGVVASGGFDWEGADWLRLALLILLADGCWGTLWAAIGGTDWATPLQRWRHWQFGERIVKPPYTLPDSPGDRVFRWFGQLRAWWRHLFWLDRGPVLTTIVIALVVTVVLALLIGPELLLVSAGAVAVMQLGLAWNGGSGRSTPGWDAIVAITLPWLAGHLAFGMLTLSSSLLALALGLAWGAAWKIESIRGRALAAGGQLVAAALLVAQSRPLAALAACSLVLLLVPQLALLPWIDRGQPAGGYVRYTRPWLMVAMLLAAWAL
jgi:hypothetical protein